MIQKDNLKIVNKRYEILSEIGKGGMAVVYRALDTALDREVALKLLHPHLVSHQESKERLAREARAVAKLKHENILEIHDFSDDMGNEAYIVMELVEGTTLRQFLQNNKINTLAIEAVALIARCVASALWHAHENGVIHRDVKPENILLSKAGEIKLTDFGIAQLAGLSQMTATGQILGSPAYMSPEHVESKEPSAKADIFSLGTILYEMTTGRLPFEGSNPHAIIKKIAEGDFIKPLDVNLSIGHYMSTVISKCLKHSPHERYDSSKELLGDLDEIIKKADINNPKYELGQMLANPLKWSDKKIPVIIKSTLSDGQAAKKNKKFLEAANHFNRVLSIDPTNLKAKKAVDGLSARIKIIKFTQVAAAIMAMLLVSSAIAWTYLSGDDEKNISNQKSNNAQTKIPKTAALNALKKKRETAESGTKNHLENKTDKPKTNQKKITPVASQKKDFAFRKKRKVVFRPFPMAVEISINGENSFTYGPENSHRMLKPGKYNFSFTPNDAVRFVSGTVSVEIPPGKESFYIRKRLSWRPATLLVNTNVPAEISSSSRFSAKSNKKIKVNIKNGPHETLILLVRAKGYSPRTMKVKLSAGELSRLSVNLKK